MGWNNAGAGGDGSALSGRPREDRVTAPVIAKQAVPRSETDAFKSEQESGTQAGRVDTPEQPFLSEEPSGARLVLPTVCVAAQADLQGELGDRSLRCMLLLVPKSQAFDHHTLYT
ncbi:activin receptor type-1-like [Arapaima gigas]